MRYDIESQRLIISAEELVSTARRGISSTLPCDIDEPENLTHGYTASGSEESSSELSFDFTAGKYDFTVFAKARIEAKNKIRIYVPTDSSPKRPKKEVTMQARGEGYLTALMLAKRENISDVEILFLYFNKNTREECEVIERVKLQKLESFFERCKMSIKVYAAPEIERVTVRIPSMKEAKFPYGKARPGQNDIARGVYKNIARGGRLFISAPTGTGKTVSLIYPAIRAMGEGKCDKVFYFTPKTTTAEAAKDTITDISNSGTKIRAIIMSSKERLCKNGLICRRNRRLCENSKENRLADAVIALYNLGLAVITPDDAARIAEAHRICPHELSLSYAELCDFIILDINYLFDPAVYIRRFFSRAREYAFLIDEAHNLPDRAREMYSATLSEEQLVLPHISPILGEHSALKNAARGAASRLFDLFMPILKEETVYDEEGNPRAATHLCEIPNELYSILEEILPAAENEIFSCRIGGDSEAEARASFVKDYYFTVKRFYDAAMRFDSAYELFVFLEDNKISLRIFCIDPASEISKRLKMGASAVFFSGTLSPIYYYKSVLGGDRGAEVIETPSPFDSGQLSVSVMDKISTRYSERERTLDAVCRAVAATVSARRGNYMIFSPSYAYSEALCKKFSQRYPKIKVLSQRKDMTRREKEEFILEFKKESDSYLVGFSVLGGIYSEGVDFSGESLIGAVIVGIGIPQLSYEREAMSAYYQDKFEEGKEFAYIYPGINKVLQAAGRVIRTETDKGAIVLIDDRFDDPLYKKLIPKLWSGMEFINDPKDLRKRLDEFWAEEKKD